MSKQKINGVRRDVMREANAIAIEAKVPRAVATRKAWMLHRLTVALATGAAVTFAYMRADGATRQAHGLKASTGEFLVKGTGKRHGRSTYLYWDVDKDGFRCFTRANIISVG